MNQSIKTAIGLTIKHYEEYGRPLKAINLHPNKWQQLRSEYLAEYPQEDVNIDHFNEIVVKDVTIRKGSEFMKDGMYLEFKVLTYDAEYKEEQKAKIEKLIDESK